MIESGRKNGSTIFHVGKVVSHHSLWIECWGLKDGMGRLAPRQMEPLCCKTCQLFSIITKEGLNEELVNSFSF